MGSALKGEWPRGLAPISSGLPCIALPIPSSHGTLTCGHVYTVPIPAAGSSLSAAVDGHAWHSPIWTLAVAAFLGNGKPLASF